MASRQKASRALKRKRGMEREEHRKNEEKKRIADQEYSKRRHQWKDFFTSWPALVSLAGLLLYGTVHFAATAFYLKLGVTPEELGVSPTSTLGRVAGQFVLFVSGAILVIAASRVQYGLWGRLRTVKRERREGNPATANPHAQGDSRLTTENSAHRLLGRPSREVFTLTPLILLASLLVAGGAIIITSLLYPTFEHHFGPWPTIAGGMIGAAFGAFSALAAILQEQGRIKNIFKAIVCHPGVDLLVASGCLAILFASSAIVGDRTAKHVLRGDAYFNNSARFIPWPSGSIGFFGLDAKPVTVAWLDQTPPLNESGWLYLGSSGQTAYLLRDKKLFRVPVSLVAIISDQGS